MFHKERHPPIVAFFEQRVFDRSRLSSSLATFSGFASLSHKAEAHVLLVLDLTVVYIVQGIRAP